MRVQHGLEEYVNEKKVRTSIRLYCTLCNKYAQSMSNFKAHFGNAHGDAVYREPVERKKILGSPLKIDH